MADAGGNNTKLQQVQKLLDILNQELIEHHLSAHDLFAKLQELKVLGRDPNQSDPIYTSEGIQTLARLGFDCGTSDASRESLRCLANALMLIPRTRQIFINLGYAEKAAANFKSDNIDDEFLLGRIIFLLTYEKNLDLSRLLEKQNLAESINQALGRHASKITGNSKAAAPATMEDMALSETLKLIFNITHFIPTQAHRFERSIPHLFAILSSRPLLDPPLQPPISNLINVFINLSLSNSTNIVFPPDNPTLHLNRLLTILDLSLKLEYFSSSSSHDFDETVPPLLSLLRTLYQVSPEPARKHLKLKLLCTTEERDLPLGRTSSLASRCLKLTTSAISSHSREITSDLLFILSDQNPYEFIRNVGYGFASGYLVSHQIPVPADAISDNESEVAGVPINPITGQFLESERKAYEPIQKELGERTQEEKMREAEKLFVLFERLKKTGVVNVKNPVEVAMETGRFQELPDTPDPGEVD